jgi:hypothetical protein
MTEKPQNRNHGPDAPLTVIWQYLRQNYLANRVFDTYGAILDAC